MEVLVARQAIFDRDGKVYGYELLFRHNAASRGFDGGPHPHPGGTAAAAATMQVLSNTVISIGTGKMLGGKKGFVNFDQYLLEAEMHRMLPKELIVVEILETVEPTLELVELCRSARGEGYTLALDDFNGDSRFNALSAEVQVIKVDMRQTPRTDQERMLRTYGPRGVVMLAEKVETHEEYQWAREAGYALFQGFFFSRPVLMRSKQIPAGRANCLRLVREGQKADIDFDSVESLVRMDVSLTYKLLSCVNSAAYARRDDVKSIRAALLVLGEDGVRRWIMIASLPALATNKPAELAVLSLVRARFCERLAELAPGPLGKANDCEAFLMGMFSLLDALIDQPLAEALTKLDLSLVVTRPLLGIAPWDDFLGRIYRLVLAYELGEWDEVCALADHCGIACEAVGDAYVEATGWAADIAGPGLPSN